MSLLAFLGGMFVGGLLFGGGSNIATTEEQAKEIEEGTGKIVWDTGASCYCFYSTKSGKHEELPLEG